MSRPLPMACPSPLDRARGHSGLSIHWPIIRRLLSHPTRTAAVDDRRTYRSIDILVGALHVAGAVRARSASQMLGVMVPTSGAFPMPALAGGMPEIGRA